MAAKPLSAPQRDVFVRTFETYETKLAGFADALSGGRIDDLQTTAHALQALSVAFAQHIRQFPAPLEFDAGLREQALRIVAHIRSLQELLARQQAQVRQALAILIPSASPDVAYGAAVARSRTGFAGLAGARSSGEFRSFAA